MEIAIIKAGGKQYKVSVGDKIKIEKIEGQEGEKAVFNEVLLVSDGQKTKIGAPFISGAKVSAEILKQDRAEKITILKYKSKKRSNVKRGHRQPYSLVEIKSIQ